MLIYLCSLQPKYWETLRLIALCSEDGVSLVFVVLILINVKLVKTVNSIVRLIKHHAIKMQAYGGVGGRRS